ncbi:MAG TPA: hypothetical protein VFM70_04430 [Salinimicrobium sp.]|nr:hypothetical protein [Salinimicrobium sp.]
MTAVPFIKIHMAIAWHYDIDMDFIHDKDLARYKTEKRHIFYYLARFYNPKKTLTTIGSYGWRKSHSQVLSGIKTISGLIENDRKLREDVEKIKEICERSKMEFTPSNFKEIKYDLLSQLIETRKIDEIKTVIRRTKVMELKKEY